jgi:UDP-N-acetyl-alpha-D-muramoyl-L-alanyl-L-glutamate epimerase
MNLYACRIDRAASQPLLAFDPMSFRSFRFMAREIDDSGRITLRYGLDEEVEFVEEFRLPLPAGRSVGAADRARVDGLLALLHWVAGVSYFKTAIPPGIACETGDPSPAVAALLEALYSEGLGEFAFRNRLAGLPRPSFPIGPAPDLESRAPDLGSTAPDPGNTAPELGMTASRGQPSRVLVPIGGGKDSVVALEIARRSGLGVSLFSVGDAPPIARTARAAGLPHLIAVREIDPGIGALNRGGALNGHVPVTAIVSCVALLVAALHGFDAVAMSNERSASSGNVQWDGIDVNHQFSKSWRAERLLRDALPETGSEVQLFSLLRPASELAIARAFARLETYHHAFTSCNASFRLDPELRATSWCRDCPKCRFVFLILAPFMAPERLAEIFGANLLDDDTQFEGFALLTATGGSKPFECVGEADESLAAIRLLAENPTWREHRVVHRLAAEVLPRFPPGAGDPNAVLALSDEHAVPAALLPSVHAVLGS